MTIYSHSRLSTFEQCPLKFKYHYIDKIETEIEQSIEAFMGDLVHQTLEKLYKDLKFEKRSSVDDLIAFYNELWERSFNDKILIVRKEYPAENFHKLGERYIREYFHSHEPFDEGLTIGTEINIQIKLDDVGNYLLQGYIDRLSCKGDIYEIHDYKTGGSLPLQEHIDQERQLGLYAIAVKEGYSDAREIKLIWHYLAFNKDLVSSRSDEDLEKLRLDTINLIKKIETTKEYASAITALCDWCNFRSICPSWKHLVKSENLTPNEYINEPGVVLANKYTQLHIEKDKLDREIQKLKDALYAYCEKEKTDVLFGSTAKLSCKTYENYCFPPKNDPFRNHLVNALKKLGKYDEVSEVDVYKLSRIMKNKEWDDNTIEILKNFSYNEKVRKIYLN